MQDSKIAVNVKVKNDIEAKQVQQAVEAIVRTFKPQELVSISKKIDNPLVLLKIRSMI
jgi:hypothetical protein